MSADAAPVRLVRGAEVRPVPWPRMAWVTWRQQRSGLVAMVTLFAALALYMWLTGLRLHHDYALAVACHPASSITCGELASNFDGTNSFLTNGLLLHALPALIGAFIGAPLLARELETGTFRYAWTQGIGRWRWTLAKLVGLSVATAAAAAALGALFSWYYQPYFGASNQQVGLIGWPSLAPGLFDVRGIDFAAWTIAALAIGALAGMLVRRVIPAILVTLGAYGALATGVGAYLRQHYLAPITTSRFAIPNSALILSRRWSTTSGSPVSDAALGRLLAKGAAGLAGKGGVPDSLGTWRYLAQHGYVQLTTYQPASRFWAFQWMEAAGLVALAVLLVGVTLWLVRRRVV